ncbi:MAG TPA: insulinase family protein [Desulfobulbus sp.]|nr:insulinase family protein [Desulfobulbus sp.]
MRKNRFSFIITGKHTLFILLSLAVLLAGCGLKPPAADTVTTVPCISQGWPQDNSDLPVDPKLVFGTLENGLRYVVVKNREPKDRVALYLDVQAGSLNETDAQRGLAHYLEHMLFNGTTHYPPGTLIEYFQSIGMSFGADTNAHTSYDETVYKLLLPSGSRESLDKGMLVLADYARGALLLENEVDQERGIILAEKRSRDSASSRVSKKLLQFEFAGTRIADRDPIGTDQTLQSANSRLLRSFYEAWYRPENMIVVLVGDTDPDQAVATIRRYFSPLKAGHVEPKCFDLGRVKDSGLGVFYRYEPDLGVTRIGLSTVWNIKPREDTVGWEKKQLLEYVAASLLDNRLQHLVNAGNSPLTKARAYSGIFVRHFGYFGLSAEAGADKWRQGLSLLEQTLRQALEYGVTDSELERVKQEFKAELEKNVQTAQSEDSGKLAMEIIQKLNSNEVVLSPLQEKELYGRMLSKITTADIEETLQRMWNGKRHLVDVAGTADLRKGKSSPEQQIEQVWRASAGAPVEAWKQAEVTEFPYLAPPAHSVPVQQVIPHRAIDAATTILANGLRINVKKTDFEDREVLLSVNFGRGLLSEPVPGLGKLATAVVHQSGVGRMTREQLDVALAGRNGRVDFSVGPESFAFSGKGLSSELELMLQLVYTNLNDPAFRPQAYARSMERFGQMYAAMQNSVEGTLQLQGDRFFAGGNPRYGLPSRDAFMQLRLEQVRKWLEKPFAHAQLEVTVVGDVEPEKVVALVRRYFGAREGKPATFGKRAPVVFPVGREKEVSVPSAVDKAVVAVGWPTDDFWDISRTRRLSVLASVLEDRLRRTIREKLGATYSPVAYNFSSRVDAGFGVLRCLLTVDPLQIGQVRKTIADIAEELVRQGITAEELQRNIAPIETSIRDLQRTNRYWLESVLVLSGRHPQQLKWPVTLRDDFASITREQINAFAQRYLQENRSATLIIRPDPKK